ncbi:probable complex I intermediate-associated protein 30 [Salvia miltiorrhiza]|uniref:probable complex I intermediate-associated protein 30 n=1 Tax=Salvia miltiorrhiza TaxID=226208 RepID=UPI0025AB7C5B|nr:probable complex I intermediate-associated protein 30 [Salvia miltiorrhiza]
MSRFRGLWQASVNATKRALLWKPEDLLPPSERYIFKFDTKEELKRWHLYTDSMASGAGLGQESDESSGREQIGVVVSPLKWRNFETWKTGCVFSGNLSLDVVEGTKWNITRSGFCGMRSKKFDGFIDLDGYDTFALKLKGDGRCYISTVSNVTLL